MALGQRLALEIEGRDEPVVVRYSAVDLRAWEREHDESCLTARTSLDMLTWLGWHAAHRQGLLNGDASTYDQLDAVCVDVRTLRGEDDAARPTPAHPSDEPSSP